MATSDDTSVTAQAVKKDCHFDIKWMKKIWAEVTKVIKGNCDVLVFNCRTVFKIVPLF